MESHWEFPAENKLLPRASNPQSSKRFARLTDTFPSVGKLRHKSISSLGQPWDKAAAMASPCTDLPATKVVVFSLHLAVGHLAETCCT